MEESGRHALPLKRAYPFAEEHGLGLEAEHVRALDIEWDLAYESSVRRGYFVELFRTHGIWDAFRQAHWPDGLTAWGEKETARLLRIVARYRAFLAGTGDPEADEPAGEVEVAGQEFAAEADLRDFLAKNLELIEPGLQLADRDGRSGVEFPVDDGRIDLLAVDCQHKFVVIELKLSRGRNKTLGQLLYYMGWVDVNLGNGPCRGLIIARDISPDLQVAVQRATGVSLFSYQLSMSLMPVV